MDARCVCAQFRALADQLEGDPEKHAAYRQQVWAAKPCQVDSGGLTTLRHAQVVGAIEQNKDWFEAFMDEARIRVRVHF